MPEEKKRTEDAPSLFEYILPEDTTDEEKEVNAIPAETVAEAIVNGMDVVIDNCVIDDDLILASIPV